MSIERLSFADALGAFAPGQPLRAVLILTYCFDGRWFEDAVAPELFERPVGTALLLRDRRNVITEAASVRYHRADAAFSGRVFHPKVALFVAEDRARAVVGSANMTRGGFEGNLELGSVFDLHPDGGPRSLFQELLAYVADPLRQEVDGAGLRALEDVALALREVIDQAPVPREASPHALLHNYKQPLWDQVRERLPHLVLRRAAVVSPFFEPDASAGAVEDPPGEVGDDSAFRRLFSDFEFEPDADEPAVSVYFREDFGVTALPVSKLKAWEDQLRLYGQLSTSHDPRRLHGKLLLLEGAGGKNRKPFLAALHGSPNFTAAALFGTPPDWNAELAILTWLPPKSGVKKATAALGLGDLFGPIHDWATLKSKPPAPAPLPHRPGFTVTDVTLQVIGQMVILSVRNAPPDAARFRISAEVEGAWRQLAECDWIVGDALKVCVPDLIVSDPKTKLLTVRAARVRVEVLNEAGAILACDEAPINVDCPQEFCGLAMVGPLLQTLDQRIAHAGSGTPMTYRAQQKWLERLRNQQQDGSVSGVVPTHQADLDRFFRNLHTGLRGLRRRLEASPYSVFTLRNALRQLSAWCAEAVALEGQVVTDECRAFLIDRLAEEMLAALDRATANAAAASGLSGCLNELGCGAAVEAALAWLSTASICDAKAYLGKTRHRFTALGQRLETLGRQR